MARKLAVVFGGSGFIGRHLIRRLAAAGYNVRAAVRDPVGAAFLKPMGEVEQVVPVFADITKPASVENVVAGADLVVNLVGILYERGKASFQAIHVDGARTVAQAAQAAGVKTLIHMSALGADKDSPAAYARSKAAGEEAVRAAFPGAVIFRPSVVFGPEDDFFNRFAAMTGWSPVLPVIVKAMPCPMRGLYRGGSPKFQPVYVGDVADAMMAAATMVSEGKAEAQGQTYELGGPTVYDMKQVMELVERFTHRKRWLAPIPMGAARFKAVFLQMLPKPILTPDQVRLMERDNVLGGSKPGLEQLGVTPTAAEVILPTYMLRFVDGAERALRR